MPTRRCGTGRPRLPPPFHTESSLSLSAGGEPESSEVHRSGLACRARVHEAGLPTSGPGPQCFPQVRKPKSKVSCTQHRWQSDCQTPNGQQMSLIFSIPRTAPADDLAPSEH